MNPFFIYELFPFTTFILIPTMWERPSIYLLHRWLTEVEGDFLNITYWVQKWARLELSCTTSTNATVASEPYYQQVIKDHLVQYLASESSWPDTFGKPISWPSMCQSLLFVHDISPQSCTASGKGDFLSLPAVIRNIFNDNPLLWTPEPLLLLPLSRATIGVHIPTFQKTSLPSQTRSEPLFSTLSIHNP